MRKRLAAAAASEELPSEFPRALLHDLHLLTREGHLNADARRKLKQIQHFLGLLQPALADLTTRFPEPTVVDCGAGKSYLGLLLYAKFMAQRGKVYSLETRPELVTAATNRAATYGFARFIALQTEIALAQPLLPARVHMVTALHACDTATDDAILLGLASRAEYIAVVPCCQAELAAKLKEHKRPANPSLSTLARHAWHRREFGSHATNVLRALLLESLGYQVTVTELTGWDHSLKNELILARRVQGFSRPAIEALERLVGDLGVELHLMSEAARLGLWPAGERAAHDGVADS